RSWAGVTSPVSATSPVSVRRWSEGTGPWPISTSPWPRRTGPPSSIGPPSTTDRRRQANVEIRRGDIFFANLNPVIGSEQGGTRPVLVLQNDIGNRHSPTTIVAAVTSRIKKAKLPTHVELRR